MGRTITQRELRNDSARIMRELAEGHEFIVTRSGVVVGRLEPMAGPHSVPVEQVRARRGAPLRLDLARLREDLDAIVDPGVR